MSKFTEDVFYEIPEYWILHVEKLLQDIEKYCIENKISLPYILQIKEKYGTLRFYYSIGEDWSGYNIAEIDLMIEMTEKLCV